MHTTSTKPSVFTAVFIKDLKNIVYAGINNSETHKEHISNMKKKKKMMMMTTTTMKMVMTDNNNQ
jgi:hypothetical protein